MLSYMYIKYLFSMREKGGYIYSTFVRAFSPTNIPVFFSLFLVCYGSLLNSQACLVSFDVLI